MLLPRQFAKSCASLIHSLQSYLTSHSLNFQASFNILDHNLNKLCIFRKCRLLENRNFTVSYENSIYTILFVICFIFAILFCLVVRFFENADDS